MIDLEELKRLHKGAVADEALADEVFLAAMVDQFAAIVAKLEAAQRLRDALDGQADGIADAIDAFDAVVTK